MKYSIILFTALISTSSFAGATDAIVDCINRDAPAIACAGVKTKADVNAVISCINRDAPAIACAGVKTVSDVDAVVGCINRDVPAVACAGVKD